MTAPPIATATNTGPAPHAVYVVAVNGRGQVVRVTPDVRSNDRAFDALTYGNALQTFIRTPGGQAIAGTYALEYAIEPGSERIRRSVRLLHAGGVDPSAEGAVYRMRAAAAAKAAGGGR